jgi:hypothetical protein
MIFNVFEQVKKDSAVCQAYLTKFTDYCKMKIRFDIKT